MSALLTRRGPLALVAVLLLGAQAWCTRRAPRPELPPAPDLASLIRELSEPGGYFDTDNLVSNETAYLQVSEGLRARGGAYIGVGPEQNFSYIARLRPRWAFVVDIRRQNMLQHLLYAGILAHAESRFEYLAWLFSRPEESPPPEGTDLARLVAVLETRPPSRELFESRLRRIFDHLTGHLRVPLTDADRAAVRAVSRAFLDGQLDLRFQTHGQPMLAHHPSYRSLLLTRSPGGHGSFLAVPEDYAYVRDLSRAGRLVPLVGDFAGPRTLRAVGRFLRQRGERVSAFYVSNVEFYLFPAGNMGRFVDNVRELPVDAGSLFIRACFHYGRDHPSRQPGHRSTTLLQPIPRFLELYDAGRFRDSWDVCTADHLP